MTALANILGLAPVMWATGTGADVMKRLAAPMVGGVLSAMLLTLVVIPALYVMWLWQTEVKYGQAGEDHGMLQQEAASSS
jgi:Cu(I)/Ag(I) efflux system membrane protein CusA/SilA